MIAPILTVHEEDKFIQDILYLIISWGVLIASNTPLSIIYKSTGETYYIWYRERMTETLWEEMLGKVCYCLVAAV